MHPPTSVSARRRTLSLLVATGLLAASCGGSDDTTDSAESEPVATTPTTQPEAPEPSEPATEPVDTQPPPDTEAPREPDDSDTATEDYELDLGDGATLLVPAGGAGDVSAVAVDVEPTDPEAEVVSAFELSPEGAVFDDPVVLSVPIPELESGNGAELALTLTSSDGSMELLGGSFDGEGLTYEIPHFSTAAFEQRDISNLIVSPRAPEPVGAQFAVGYGGAENPAGAWKAVVHLGTDKEAVKVVDAASATLLCAQQGTSDLFFVSEETTRADGGASMFVAHLDVTCVQPLGVTADQVSLSENHTDKSLLTQPGWFSVIMALIESVTGGLVTPVLDTDCNGEIGAGDQIIFEPVPVDADGMAVMGIERFGCNAIAIFPEDATFPPDTFPFQIDGPPTQRDNGTWQFAGPLEDLEIEVVVTDFETGDTAVWQVSGIDGDMSLIP